MSTWKAACAPAAASTVGCRRRIGANARSGAASCRCCSSTRCAELDDADAWFGHSSNNPAWLVNERLGFETTRHQYLKVRWFRDLPEERKREIEDQIDAIGSF